MSTSSPYREPADPGAEREPAIKWTHVKCDCNHVEVQFTIDIGNGKTQCHHHKFLGSDTPQSKGYAILYHGGPESYIMSGEQVFNGMIMEAQKRGYVIAGDAVIPWERVIIANITERTPYVIEFDWYDIHAHKKKVAEWKAQRGEE